MGVILNIHWGWCFIAIRLCPHYPLSSHHHPKMIQYIPCNISMTNDQGFMDFWLYHIWLVWILRFPGYHHLCQTLGRPRCSLVHPGLSDQIHLWGCSNLWPGNKIWMGPNHGHKDGWMVIMILLITSKDFWSRKRQSAINQKPLGSTCKNRWESGMPKWGCTLWWAWILLSTLYG